MTGAKDLLCDRLGDPAERVFGGQLGACSPRGFATGPTGLRGRDSRRSDGPEVSARPPAARVPRPTAPEPGPRPRYEVAAGRAGAPAAEPGGCPLPPARG